VKLRLKSVASAMLGMGDMMMMEQRGRAPKPDGDDEGEQPVKEQQQQPKKPGVSDVLKGLFGR